MIQVLRMLVVEGYFPGFLGCRVLSQCLSVCPRMQLIHVYMPPLDPFIQTL